MEKKLMTENIARVLAISAVTLVMTLIFVLG